MTDELWVDEKDIIANEDGPTSTKANIGKKRKSTGEKEEPAAESPAPKKAKKAAADNKSKPAGDDDKLDKQIAERKSKLRSAKAKSRKSMDA